MAAKRDGQPISFRIPDDLADALRKFVEKQPDWSQTELLCVGLHAILSANEDDRIAALAGYRKRARGGTRPK